MQLFRIIFLLAKLQNKKETAKQFPNFISTSAASNTSKYSFNHTTIYVLEGKSTPLLG